MAVCLEPAFGGHETYRLLNHPEHPNLGGWLAAVARVQASVLQFEQRAGRRG